MQKTIALLIIFLFYQVCFAQVSKDIVIESEVQNLISIMRERPRNVEKVKHAALDITTRYDLDCVQFGRVYQKLGSTIYFARDESYYNEGIQILQDSTFDVWTNCDSLPISKLWVPSYLLLTLYEYQNRALDAAKVIDYLDTNPSIHEGRSPYLLLDLFGRIASLKAEAGDYITAQQYFNKAGLIYDSVETIQEKFDYIERYGTFLNDAQRYEESIHTYKKAFDLRQDAQDSLILLANYMSPLLNTKKFDEIEVLIKDLDQLILKSNYDHYTSYAYSQSVKYYLATDQLVKAKQNIDSLESMIEKDSTNRTLLSDYYSSSGTFYAAKNDYKNSIHNYEKAIRNQVVNAKPNLYNVGPDLVKYTINEYETLIINLRDLFKVYHKKYTASSNEEDLEKALGMVEELDGLFQQNRSSFNSEFSKIKQLENTYTVFEEAIDLCHSHYQNTKDQNYLFKALSWSAKNKNSILNNLISSNKLYESRLTKEEYNQLAKLEQQKRIVESELIAENGFNKELNQSFIDLQAEEKKLLQSFNQKYPELKKNITSQTLSDSELDIKSKLDGKTALVDIFYGQENIYVFAVSKSNSFFKKLKNNAPFKAQLSSIENYLYSYSNAEKLNQETSKIYTFLLKPFLQTLEASGVSELIVAPDGNFHNIPLEILWTGDDYLVNKYNFTYLYSYSQLNNAISSIGNNYLGYGTSYSDSLNTHLNSYFSDPTHGMNNLDVQNIQLAKLASSSKEVESANELYRGKMYLGDASTKDNFLKYAPQSSGILHLALHGLILNENSSCIVFDDSQKDMVLSSNEVYGLKLKNEMSILSACYSATGKIYKGEGVRNLARSFLYAGSKSIVPSLWASSDVSTGKLIQSFLNKIKEGNSASTALTQAKRDYLKTASPAYRHPAYWGNMIYVGTPSLYHSMTEGIKLFLVVAAGLLILFWMNRRKKKSSL